jgi:hypothetical protein
MVRAEAHEVKHVARGRCGWKCGREAWEVSWMELWHHWAHSFILLLSDGPEAFVPSVAQLLLVHCTHIYTLLFSLGESLKI